MHTTIVLTQLTFCWTKIIPSKQLSFAAIAVSYCPTEELHGLVVVQGLTEDKLKEFHNIIDI